MEDTIKRVNDRILEAIKGNEYIIHTNKEDDFKYLNDGDISIEIINRTKSMNLFIETDWAEYTLYYGDDYHEHFYVDDDEDEEEYLIRYVAEILSNERCAAAIYYNNNGKLKWLGSCSVKREIALKNSVNNTFAFVFKTKEFRDKIEKNGGEVRYCYWDGDLDNNIVLHAVISK